MVEKDNMSTCQRCKVDLSKLDLRDKKKDILKQILHSKKEFQIFELTNFLREEVKKTDKIIKEEEKQNDNFCICIECKSKLENLIFESFQKLFKTEYEKEYIELLKYNGNTNLFFEKIIQENENNNGELNYDTLSTDTLTEEEAKTLEEINETEESISKLEKENFILKQTLEYDKNQFNRISRILFKNVNKNDIFDIINMKKIVLTYLFSIQKNEIDSWINERNNRLTKYNFISWGKILHLTDIICRIKGKNLLHYKIFVLGHLSYFQLREKPFKFSENSAENLNLIKEFIKLLCIIDNGSYENDIDNDKNISTSEKFSMFLKNFIWIYTIFF